MELNRYPIPNPLPLPHKGFLRSETHFHPKNNTLIIFFPTPIRLPARTPEKLLTLTKFPGIPSP